MMDFARRLAPVRDSDPSRAVAVLPSRFDGEGAVRESSPQLQPRAAEAVAPEGVQPSAAPARPAAAGDAVSQARAEVPVVAVVLPTQVHRSSAAASFNEQLPVPRPSAPGPASHAAVLPARATERAHAQAAAAPAQPAVQAIAATPATTPTPAVRAPLPQPAVRAPLPQAAVRSPLSEAALASRALATAAEPRPVIHVSIDRIEVRAAAKPAPAPVAQRGRTAPASVSLADYLRRSSPKPGGRP